jgi:hypothetical protein
MMVFTAGRIVPCKKYPSEPRPSWHFEALGVIVAISTDNRDRAQRAAKEWGLSKLPVAYGLPVDGARKWGLYISHGLREGEPALFSEPGLFLVRRDLTLQYAAINSGARGRPAIADMLGAVQFMIENNAPPRGEA